MPQHAKLKRLLMVLQCLLFTTTVTTNTVRVVRRISNQFPDRDAFSNPSCNPNDCPANSTCLGSCCMCHCVYDYPNFLVRRWECLNTLNFKVNTACAFSIRPHKEPVEVLLTTEEDKGKVKFTSSNVRISCNDEVIVSRWDYLNAHDQWVQGRGNVFLVSHGTVGGANQDKKDLTFLEWNSRLDPRYSGLLIRLWLNCKSKANRIGCLLAKLNGTFTYDMSSPTVTSPISPTTLSTTLEQVTTTNHSLTNGDVKDPTTTSKRNTAGEQVLVTHRQEQQPSTALGPIIGIVGGVIALLCLISILIIFYRRRRSCLSCITKENGQRESVENYENPQDSIYAEVAGIGPDFDNLVYIDPAAENLNRRSKQDPLPNIPGSESSYQPLNEMTRSTAPTESESISPPFLPPISYPMGDGLDENVAYDDYVRQKTLSRPETEDYANPLTTNASSSGNGQSNYDNPSRESITESSNYDNPLQALPPTKIEQKTEDSSSVNADTEDGPEYFELEPELNEI